eukprot:gnl/TRDRNA2_/TRDRNA2_146033_c0_seq2.p1 gnl/TRDRNA2_/TRDRNA2_146033_c0~~gnl/TRDRNA2_/TRDRNA2_146033_c0_seq2.p1  ORF type:complete len:128 (-),score=17.48 gnl/TRDRNA2_/TRDRNA2_146033_c0_seq2:16-399(-)
MYRTISSCHPKYCDIASVLLGTEGWQLAHTKTACCERIKKAIDTIDSFDAALHRNNRGWSRSFSILTPGLSKQHRDGIDEELPALLSEEWLVNAITTDDEIEATVCSGCLDQQLFCRSSTPLERSIR